jgi:hypothetical protein
MAAAGIPGTWPWRPSGRPAIGGDLRRILSARASPAVASAGRAPGRQGRPCRGPPCNLSNGCQLSPYLRLPIRNQNRRVRRFTCPAGYICVDERNRAGFRGRSRAGSQPSRQPASRDLRPERRRARHRGRRRDGQRSPGCRTSASCGLYGLLLTPGHPDGGSVIYANDVRESKLRLLWTGRISSVGLGETA